MGVVSAMNKEQEEWEVRNAVDTLKRAEEIRNDPKMMKKVKAEANKQKKALEKVGGPAPKKKAPAKKKTNVKKTSTRKKK